MAQAKDGLHWSEALRAFRRRNGLKQEAAAALLGVSQAYVSRMESGSVAPSPAVIRRLKALGERPEHRLVLDMIRASVRHYPGLVCLVRRDEGGYIIEEQSRAFELAGHPFDRLQRGSAVNWVELGSEALELMEQLDRAGAFDGLLRVGEVVWSAAPRPCGSQRHFIAAVTPMRGEDDLWRMHAALLEIDADTKKAMLQDWRGPIRLMGQNTMSATVSASG